MFVHNGIVAARENEKRKLKNLTVSIMFCKNIIGYVLTLWSCLHSGEIRKTKLCTFRDYVMVGKNIIDYVLEGRKLRYKKKQ